MKPTEILSKARQRLQQLSASIQAAKEETLPQDIEKLSLDYKRAKQNWEEEREQLQNELQYYKSRDRQSSSGHTSTAPLDFTRTVPTPQERDEIEQQYDIVLQEKSNLPYLCPVCAKAFKYGYESMAHQMTEHGIDRPRPCRNPYASRAPLDNTCNMPKSQKLDEVKCHDNMASYEKYDQQYVRPICSTTFVRKDKFMMHKKIAHSTTNSTLMKVDIESSKQEQTDRHDYSCEFIQSMLKLQNNDEFMYHRNMALYEKSSLSYVCPVCSMIFVRKDQFVIHKQMAHNTDLSSVDQKVELSKWEQLPHETFPKPIERQLQQTPPMPIVTQPTVTKNVDDKAKNCQHSMYRPNQDVDQPIDLSSISFPKPLLSEQNDLISAIPQAHVTPVESNVEFDKNIIYEHPLFPLLILVFEKCEQSQIYSPEEWANGVSWSKSFQEDVDIFSMQMRNDNPYYIPDPEVDSLMISAIRVLWFQLIEIEKVHEQCNDFCRRYICSMKERLPQTKDLEIRISETEEEEEQASVLEETVKNSQEAEKKQKQIEPTLAQSPEVDESESLRRKEFQERFTSSLENHNCNDSRCSITEIKSYLKHTSTCTDGSQCKKEICQSSSRKITRSDELNFIENTLMTMIPTLERNCPLHPLSSFGGSVNNPTFKLVVQYMKLHGLFSKNVEVCDMVLKTDKTPVSDSTKSSDFPLVLSSKNLLKSTNRKEDTARNSDEDTSDKVLSEVENYISNGKKSSDSFLVPSSLSTDTEDGTVDDWELIEEYAESED